MHKQSRGRLLAAGSLIVVWTLIAAPKDPPKTNAKPGEQQFAAKLNQRVNFPGLDDPRVTLAEQLEILANRYEMTIDINEQAFSLGKGQQTMGPGKTLLTETGPIPPMKNVRLETVLRKILDRLPGATFTVRPDRVEITNYIAQQDEFWPNAIQGVTPFYPLMNITFDKKPLDEALAELAERTGCAIVLDAGALAKEKPPVTARFKNTPLDRAVRLLAEMSDLRSVDMGKTIFVTTAEKAKRLDPRPTPHRPTAAEMAAKVREIRKFNGFDDPETTLEEALLFLERCLDITIEVNEAAFKKEMVPEVLKTLIADPAWIPPFTGTLDSMIKRLLAKVPAPSGAVYLVRAGRIEITTEKAREIEFYRNRPKKEAMTPRVLAVPPPLVNASIAKVTFAAAIGDLAHDYEATIVVDVRAEKEAKTEITAELRNVPLDTAVQLLADMAGLTVVEVGNVLYVTTPDNGRALQQKQEKRSLTGPKKPRPSK